MLTAYRGTRTDLHGFRMTENVVRYVESVKRRASRSRVSRSGPPASVTSSGSTAPHSSPRSTNAGERAGGGGLVEVAGVALVHVGPQPASADGRPVPEERVRRDVAAGQLGRMQVPALVEPALQRPAHQPGVQPPRGVHRIAGRPTGSTLVEPSDSRTPVPAAATCITAFAWSAAGCSMLWYAAAIPSEAE